MQNRLKDRFQFVRAQTELFCKDLALEDFSVQPEIFVSPPKWHLAHTTWFFEQFVLLPHAKDYKVYHDDFAFLFNSYYNNVGKRVLRPNRGLMTRPSVKKVLAYRTYVSNAILHFLQEAQSPEILEILEIGINHEEQHQELLAYDVKYILGQQALFPSFKSTWKLKEESNKGFVKVEEGLYKIGHQDGGFCFDNELGVHKVYLQEFEMRKSLVSNGEYIDFINDGAYENFNLWHADGWDFIKRHEIKAPLYWHLIDGEWHCYNFHGLQKVDPNIPVSHISFYEAFAFAEWKKMRLPTEFEWEIASAHLDWGQLWEWTNSAYLPYPGFNKKAGALGEYNGKFMVNQQVLRGASMGTPKAHKRFTYRNFFQAEMRWMFAGIRLVK